MRAAAMLVVVLALLGLGSAVRAQQPGRRPSPARTPGPPAPPRVVCGMTLVQADPRLDPDIGTDRLGRPAAPPTAVIMPPPVPGSPSVPAPPVVPQVPPAPPFAPAPPPVAPAPPRVAPAPPVPPSASAAAVPAPPPRFTEANPSAFARQPEICWP